MYCWIPWAHTISGVLLHDAYRASTRGYKYGSGIWLRESGEQWFREILGNAMRPSLFVEAATICRRARYTLLSAPGPPFG